MSTIRNLISSRLGLSSSSAIHLSVAFLMCPPKFYDVNYVINPWMAGNLHASSQAQAAEQWQCLYEAVKQVAAIVLVEPRPGLPDMVFTANAGLERNGVIVLSNFFHPERQGEEQHFRHWFERAGYAIVSIPREISFEGEGDALFAVDGSCLWAGYGTRTQYFSHQYLSKAWNLEVVSLHLIDPRFYHLDTCFAPLQFGYVMYYPPAFDKASIEKIETYYSMEKRIIVSEADALQFACNLINVDSTVILNESGKELRDQLKEIGFNVIEVPLGEFLKAGGAAKCLVMRLSG
jgi:N-dimethylarginine dimethylaminohydrolase